MPTKCIEDFCFEDKPTFTIEHYFFTLSDPTRFCGSLSEAKQTIIDFLKLAPDYLSVDPEKTSLLYSIIVCAGADKHIRSSNIDNTYYFKIYLDKRDSYGLPQIECESHPGGQTLI